jgi:ADP-heptose:LPS heptosyltransferase/lauroyl/myristoyl acyltransferase
MCATVARCLYFIQSKKRQYVLSSLQKAFPDADSCWHKQMTRRSFSQMLELFLFGLAMGGFSEKQLRKRIKIEPETLKKLTDWIKDGPNIILSPHLTMMEGLVFLPAVIPSLKGVGIFFRPLDLQFLNTFIQKTRERFGAVLLSRKKDLLHSRTILQNGGSVAILFDQHAGEVGALSLFCNQLASTTDFPALLAQRYQCRSIMLFAERTGFWKCTLQVQEMPSFASVEGYVTDMNERLEAYLRKGSLQCADWLWIHDRWKFHRHPTQRLNVSSKKDYLTPIRAQKDWPKTYRLSIRLPNWLGDVVMALPLIQTIRNSRPDVEITLLIQKKFQSFFEQFPIADRIQIIPEKGFRYFRFFYAQRKRRPDTVLLFTNSQRGDLEAWFTGAPQRFSLCFPGKKRPLLTHVWNVPSDLDLKRTHQTHVWEHFLRYFGLSGAINYDPLPLNLKSISKQTNRGNIVSLICGTENAPEKRWPIPQWIELIRKLFAQYPTIRIQLLGTPKDRVITDEIAHEFTGHSLENSAGQTDLSGFIEKLSQSDLIVTADTGGMHLANALGLRIVALFGPTNPLRTGPIFNGPVNILQPNNCPRIGGMPMATLDVETVFNTMEAALRNLPHPESE